MLTDRCISGIQRRGGATCATCATQAVAAPLDVAAATYVARGAPSILVSAAFTSNHIGGPHDLAGFLPRRAPDNGARGKRHASGERRYPLDVSGDFLPKGWVDWGPLIASFAG